MRRALHRVAVVVATVVYAGWTRRSGLFLFTVVGIAAALEVATATTYTYGGSAQVLIGPPPGTASSTGAALTVRPSQLADAAIVMASPQLRRDTATLLSVPVAQVPPATATVQAGTDVVSVSVVSTSAKGAAHIAVAYADAYVAAQQLAAVSSLEQTATTLAGRISSLGDQIEALDRRIVAAGGPAPATTTVTTVPQLPIPGGPDFSQPFTPVTTSPYEIAPAQLPTGNPAVDALEQQRAGLQDQQAVLQQQATTLQTEAAAFGGGGQIVSGGVPDTHPVSPDKVRYGVIGGLAALLVGTAAVSAHEYRRKGAVEPRFGRARPAATLPPAATPPAVVAPAAAAPTAATAPAAAGAAPPDPPPGGAGGRTIVLRVRPAGGPDGGGTGSVRFVSRVNGSGQRATDPGTPR